MKRLTNHTRFLIRPCNTSHYSSSSTTTTSGDNTNMNTSSNNPIDCVIHQYSPRICNITLNKPHALNALDYDMIKSLLKNYDKWNNDPLINIMIMKGAGDKAFSAGSDLKRLYYNMKAGNEKFVQENFALLNEMCYKLASCKPLSIAIWNGFIIGAGIGVSANSKIKIATERALLSFSEVTIGYWTDILAGSYLPKLKNHFGYYLGLTGRRVNGRELVQIGMADYLVKEESLLEIEVRIKNLAPKLGNLSNEEKIKAVKTVLSEYEIPVKEGLKEEKLVDEYFRHGSLKEIWRALENPREADKAWASSILDQMSKNGKLGMTMAFEQFKRGKGMTLEENHQMDLIVNQKLVLHQDFMEGIRCRLIERGATPKWAHNSVYEVKQEEIEYYFGERRST